jgi:hypothetical protein
MLHQRNWGPTPLCGCRQNKSSEAREIGLARRIHRPHRGLDDCRAVAVTDKYTDGFTPMKGVDLEDAIETHLQLMNCMIDKIFEKTISTLYRGQDKKKKEWLERLSTSE